MRACSGEQELAAALDSVSAEHPAALSFSSHLPQIEECFSAPTVLEILARLEGSGSGFAARTLATLRGRAPTALCVTRALQARVQGAGLEECLEWELGALRALYNSPARHDVREGYRAALPSSAHKPAFKPAAVAEVEPGLVREILATRASDYFK